MPPSTAMPTLAATPAPQAAGSSDLSQFGNYSDWAQQEMAKGFTADELKQTLADNKVAIAPAAGGAPAGGDNESWWSKLLPTAGGVLGGIAGGAADIASLGLLSPLINPITGAAVGGALGQGAENVTKGQDFFQANDLSSGIENGVGQAIGGGVGKIVGALGEGMASAGTKAAENVASKEAAQAASKQTIDDATATNLNFGGIHADTQNAMELGKQQDLVKTLGFDHTNPYDMQKVSEGGGLLNNVYDKALTNAADVNTSDVNKALFTQGAKDTTKLSPEEVTNLEKQGINPDALKTATVSGGTPASSGTPLFEANSPTAAALQDFTKQTGVNLEGGLPENMPATQVRQLQQAVGRQIGNVQATINSAKLNGIYNGEMTNELSKLSDLYSTLGSKIKTPEVNQAIASSTVSDADRQGLVAQYGDKLGNHIADTINNAQSADDLLGPMQQFTKMGQASKMAINDIENVTGSPRAVKRAQFKENGGVAVPGASQASNPTTDAVMAAASVTGHPIVPVLKAAGHLHKAGVTPKIAQMMGNTLTRSSKIIPPVATAMSNIPNISAEGGHSSAIPAVPGQGEPTMQPGAAADMNPMNSLYATLLAQEKVAPTVMGPSAIPALAGMVPGVQNNAMAATEMNALAPTFANAGGPQGAAGGLLARLTALMPGTAANTYQNQQEAAAAQIAKALGITPQQAMAMLPSMMQSPGTAAPQMQATGGLVHQLTAGLPAQ